ncbi:MAG TPA: CDP-diacylglycerol--serine O-phosphatidyltransferase [Stellaceae bacterium]|jgi:CDP-diacylglycerol--serine O-phosphatidyltransferase|nr:CDP-diacylglycerol--serine O-phosphatidyltransferase [Stellaceae bacterium]
MTTRRVLLRRARARVNASGNFSINRLIPNILTLLALCAGMTAIRFALQNKFEPAVIAIMVAALLDGVDGRIARFLKATTVLGAQLDSLSDFVSFGVAPAVLLYVWSLSQLESFGWAVVVIFATCCALRLARFNAQLGTEPPAFAYNFFIGVPAPAAAVLAILPMLLSFQFGESLFRSPYVNGLVLAAVAALMVSRVPTYSFKRFRVKRDWVLPTLLVIGALAAFITTEPWATLAMIALLYLGSIPASYRAYQKMRRGAEERRVSAPRPL